MQPLGDARYCLLAVAKEGLDYLPPYKQKMSLRLRKWNRLRKCYEFQNVRKEGTVIHENYFIFQILTKLPKTDTPAQKLGVIASKKVGNAVRRNLGKRLVREVFRIHSRDLPHTCDLVVILRRKSQPFVFAEMVRQFLNCCKKIKSL